MVLYFGKALASYALSKNVKYKNASYLLIILLLQKHFVLDPNITAHSTVLSGQKSKYDQLVRNYMLEDNGLICGSFARS